MTPEVAKLLEESWPTIQSLTKSYSRTEGEDIAQEFVLKFDRVVELYDAAKGQAWDNYLVTRVKFFCLDYQRVPRNNPVANYHSRGRWTDLICHSLFDDVKRESKEGQLIDFVASKASDDHAQQDSFEDLLSSLPAATQRVLRLRFHDGLTVEEIAAAFETPPRYVSLTLEGALDTLRVLFRD